jgi:hypothetical protein
MTSNSDSDIKIVIRTGTSTSPPRPNRNEIATFSILRSNDEIRGLNNGPNNHIYDLLNMYNVEATLEYVNSPLIVNEILRRSIEDTELKRNPNITLDLESYSCDTDEEEDECSICQKNFSKDEKLTILNCEHTFHYDCIQEWGKYRATCPLCRRSINTV